MDTLTKLQTNMIILRTNTYSASGVGKKIYKGFRKGWSGFKEYGTPIMGAGSLGLSTAYYLNAKSKKKSDKIYQDKQLDAMTRLTNELQNTSSSMKKVNTSLRKFNNNPIGNSNNINTASNNTTNKPGFFRRLRRRLGGNNNN